jgi:DNA-binding response OmpR family regulator
VFIFQQNVFKGAEELQILVAEDEISLANALKRILEQKGYYVDLVHDGASALDYAQGMAYQLIILDVMLPELDGFSVVREIRNTGIHTPVLMLTARTATSDKVIGLNSGADDYMTKPFDPEELLARVSALTRRTGEVIVDRITYEDLTLDLQSAALSCGKESVQLSRKEFEVLKTFLYQPSMTISTDTLIMNAWGIESEATDNNVEVYISFIRKKLKYLNSRVGIKKLQKIGYRLEVRPC